MDHFTFLARSSDETTTILRILHYVPNKPVAGIVGGIYILIAAALLYRVYKMKSWWGLCLPIGAVVMGVGFFVRIVNVSNQNSLGLYIIQQLMIVLSPAAFLAFNYILFGMFIARCVGPEHSLIPAEKFGRVFVVSDVVTFLVQAGGGALEVSHNAATANTGAQIFLVGLVLQAVSYVIFLSMALWAHLSIRKSKLSTGREEWWKIIWLIYFSSVFILIRCVYRIIEGAQGKGGYLLTHEIYFYLLDIHPLAWAIGIYIIFWPSDYLIHGRQLEEQINTYQLA